MRRVLDDIQKAEMRRRRRVDREKLIILAAEFGVSLGSAQRICAGMRTVGDLSGYEGRDRAIAIADQAAALFGLKLHDLQRPRGRGQPVSGDPVTHARAAAVAAMRTGAQPIAWEVIQEVLDSTGRRGARLNLQRLLRRARATSREAA